MNELEDLAMQLIAAQECGDREQWQDVASRIAEMKGDDSK